MAYKQERFGCHGLPKTVDNGELSRIVKINYHITAEYNIQIPLP
jgi:hypothetical protein